MTCSRCGTALAASTRACYRCGAPVDAEPMPVEAARFEATVQRSSLSEPAVPETAPEQVNYAPEQVNYTPDEVSYAPSGANYQWPVEPAQPQWSTGGSSIPGVVLLVALGMFVLAGVVIYPLHALPVSDLISALFSGTEFSRAFASLILYVVVLFLGMALALALLGAGLLRGSRVAQILSCIVAAIVALAVIVEHAADSGPGQEQLVSGPVVAVVVCIAIAVIALLTMVPNAAAFFRRDGRPIGVASACAVNTYVGAVFILDGALFMCAGALGVKFVFIGLAFAAAGCGFVAVNKYLRAGSAKARNVCVWIYVGLVVLVLIQSGLSSSQGGGFTASVLVPIAFAVAGICALCIPQTSKEHFAGYTGSAKPTAVGWWAVLIIGLVVLAVLGFVQAAHSSSDLYGSLRSITANPAHVTGRDRA